MAVQENYTWDQGQDIIVQTTLASPTTISGWAIQFDLMYRLGSPQPIYSAYCASGFNAVSGSSPAVPVSGLLVVDGTNGVFQIPLYYALISGIAQSTNVLTYKSKRVDSGNVTDIGGGLILLAPI